MPRIQPLLPLLRPLAAPRRAACEHLFRFSTATRLRIEHPAATVGAASSIKKSSKTPQTSPEAPLSPKEASRAAGLAAAEAATDADNPTAPAPKPILPSTTAKSTSPKRAQAADDVEPSSTPAQASDATTDLKTVRTKTLKTANKESKPVSPSAIQRNTLELPPPRYHVARSKSRNLPIYTDYKRGGNLHLTTIRKITGDLSALRDELRVFLNKKNEDVKINSLNQHVIVKGHHKPQIAGFLVARGM